MQDAGNRSIFNLVLGSLIPSSNLVSSLGILLTQTIILFFSSSIPIPVFFHAFFFFFPFGLLHCRITRQLTPYNSGFCSPGTLQCCRSVVALNIPDAKITGMAVLPAPWEGARAEFPPMQGPGIPGQG